MKRTRHFLILTGHEKSGPLETTTPTTPRQAKCFQQLPKPRRDPWDCHSLQNGRPGWWVGGLMSGAVRPTGRGCGTAPARLDSEKKEPNHSANGRLGAKPRLTHSPRQPGVRREWTAMVRATWFEAIPKENVANSPRRWHQVQKLAHVAGKGVNAVIEGRPSGFRQGPECQSVGQPGTKLGTSYDSLQQVVVVVADVLSCCSSSLLLLLSSFFLCHCCCWLSVVFVLLLFVVVRSCCFVVLVAVVVICCR